MADQTPSCCDTKLELLAKIVLQFQELVPGGVSSSLLPKYNDDSHDLYYKLAATLTLI